MFIIEDSNSTVTSPGSGLHDTKVVSQAKCSPYRFDEMAKLRALFLGLIRQNRWIYFLNDKIKVRAEHLPVLQVKLKEHHCQYQSLQRIILSGHCSAVVVEQNQLSTEQLESIHHLSAKHKVQLILLENLQDSETLH